MAKCSLLIEMYGPGEVLCFTAQCDKDATHYYLDTPICMAHKLEDEVQANMITLEEYEHKKLVEALERGPQVFKPSVDRSPTLHGKRRF